MQTRGFFGQFGVGEPCAVEQTNVHPRLKACRPGLLEHKALGWPGQELMQLRPHAACNLANALPELVGKVALPGVCAGEQAVQL